MVSKILDNIDSITDKIVEKTKLSKAEIKKLIKEKQEEYGGLLTEAGAAYSIAKEHNVLLDEEKEMRADSEKIKLKDLAEGLVSFNTEVEVKSIYPTKTFEKNNRKGVVTNAEVFDETGSTRLVIWGRTEEIEKINRGAKLKIYNAYSKKNNDKVEIHIGNRGNIEIEAGAEKITKLSDVREGTEDITFYARVIRPFPVYEFDKAGKPGKVSSVSLTDGESTMRLVLWNEHADLSKELYTNDLIKVENAYARMNKDLELHLGWKGRILQNQKAGIPEIKIERKKIKELKNDKDVEIKADVVEVYQPTVISLCSKCKAMSKDETCEKCGNTEKIQSLIVNAELDDGTGVIRGTFYRDKAEQLLEIKAQGYNAENLDKLKEQVLGKQLTLFGEVKEVPEYNRREFVVRRFSNPDFENEIKKLSEEEM